MGKCFIKCESHDGKSHTTDLEGNGYDLFVGGCLVLSEVCHMIGFPIDKIPEMVRAARKCTETRTKIDMNAIARMKNGG